MEWDQILFKKIAGKYKKWKNKDTEAELARTIHLEDISARLTMLARALTGKAIDLKPAEAEGGWRENVFYLPLRFNLLPTRESNLRFYLFRIVYLSIQSGQKLNWSRKGSPPGIQDSRARALAAAPRVLKIMQDEYPAIAEMHNEIKEIFTMSDIPAYWLYGKYMVSKDVFDSGDNLAPTPDIPEKHNDQPGTELQAKPVEEVEVISVDKKAQENFMLTHNFEKVETADEFSGVWRGFDGDDELEEHADALSELNLRHLVRTDEQAHSIWNAAFRNLANIAESQDAGEDTACLYYPEWDFSQRRYKPDFCKVFVKNIAASDLSYAQKCIAENQKNLQALRRKFAQIHQQRRMVKKLPDGEDIDMDAVVDWFASLRSGHTPLENIYFAKRKKDPNIAILFLLDISLSTDSYADGNRILDVEKQAVTLFGEVLEEYKVEFAIGGFYSKTRNHCVFQNLKGFNESWTLGKRKLSAVQPQGYTRIGPALRHSKTIIQQNAAKQKWVILLSDGKPNDYDKYEGRYGIADVKQALREMHENHIQTYAIAIESTARYYLPEMFGQNHYNILSHPDMLVPSLAVLYRRINNSQT